MLLIWKSILLASNIAGIPSCVLVWKRGYMVPGIFISMCILASFNLHWCHLVYDVRHDECRLARQIDWLAALTAIAAIFTISLKFEHRYVELYWWAYVFLSMFLSTFISRFHEARLLMVIFTTLAQAYYFTHRCHAWAIFKVRSPAATEKLKTAAWWLLAACCFLFGPSPFLSISPLIYLIGHSTWHVMCGYATLKMIQVIACDDLRGAAANTGEYV